MNIEKCGDKGVGCSSSQESSNTEEVERAVDDPINPEDSVSTEPHQQIPQEVIIKTNPKRAVTRHEDLNQLYTQLYMAIQVQGETLKAMTEGLSEASHKHATNAALPALETERCQNNEVLTEIEATSGEVKLLSAYHAFKIYQRSSEEMRCAKI